MKDWNKHMRNKSINNDKIGASIIILDRPLWITEIKLLSSVHMGIKWRSSQLLIRK